MAKLTLLGNDWPSCRAGGLCFALGRSGQVGRSDCSMDWDSTIQPVKEPLLVMHYCSMAGAACIVKASGQVQSVLYMQAQQTNSKQNLAC